MSMFASEVSLGKKKGYCIFKGFGCTSDRLVFGGFGDL